MIYLYINNNEVLADCEPYRSEYNKTVSNEEWQASNYSAYIEDGEIILGYKDTRSYAQKRAAEYPNYEEYLDAQVKINSNDEVLIAQGQTQLAQYYIDCLTIKNKYPKS